MGQPWPRTPEQQKFCDEKLAEFKQLKRKKGFKEKFVNEWFQKWPEHVSVFGPNKPLNSLSAEENDVLKAAKAKRINVSTHSLI
jgi:hypothetical protein